MTNREAAISIIRSLRSAGFDALLAGGCVRDMLLRRRAKDYDAATSATPKEVMKLFRRTLKVGAKFGVVIVLVGKQQVEVATFRSESGYADGRHPANVRFCSAQEDAKRRDFTINGMFYDPVKRKVIDYVGGKKDVKKRLIRTIGVPDERFSEDYLRMLRAVRFSTQLDFEIETNTYSAIGKNAKKITKISGERIAAELESMLASPNRGYGVRLLHKSRLAEVIFKGYSKKKSDAAVKVLQQLPMRVNFCLALAAMFADCTAEFAVEKIRLLKLSRNRMRHLKFLLSNRSVLLDSRMSLAKLRKLAAEPYFNDLYEFQKAIQKAADNRRSSISPLIKVRHRLRALGDIELKPKPLLNGYDLIKLGAVAGPVLGQLSEQMYVEQLEGILKNKQQAKIWAKTWIEKHHED